MKMKEREIDMMKREIKKKKEALAAHEAAVKEAAQK